MNPHAPLASLQSIGCSGALVRDAATAYPVVTTTCSVSKLIPLHFPKSAPSLGSTKTPTQQQVLQKVIKDLKR